MTRYLTKGPDPLNAWNLLRCRIRFQRIRRSPDPAMLTASVHRGREKERMLLSPRVFAEVLLDGRWIIVDPAHRLAATLPRPQPRAGRIDCPENPCCGIIMGEFYRETRKETGSETDLSSWR